MYPTVKAFSRSHGGGSRKPIIMALQEPKFWIISQNPAAGGILRKKCKKTAENDAEMTKFWEVHTRPCEVLGKVILDLLRFWAPMRLALDTHGGVGGVSRKPIITKG